MESRDRGERDAHHPRELVALEIRGRPEHRLGGVHQERDRGRLAVELLGGSRRYWSPGPVRRDVGPVRRVAEREEEVGELGESRRPRGEAFRVAKGGGSDERVRLRRYREPGAQRDEPGVLQADRGELAHVRIGLGGVRVERTGHRGEERDPFALLGSENAECPDQEELARPVGRVEVEREDPLRQRHELDERRELG